MSLKKLNQRGFHAVEIIIVLVVLAVIGLVGWKVVGKQKARQTGDTAQNTQTAETAEQLPETSMELIWQQSDSGWTSTQTPPACADPLVMKVPVDLSKVTAILYPGQTRGGNYKPHGGFRLDGTANDKVTVTAPIDGFIVRGGHYLAEGEIQYTFDIMNNCGVMYRLGHFRALPESLQKLTNDWPAALAEDSRTHSINPPVYVKQGETLATSVGIVKDKNVFFDWGVYDYRKQNETSKSAAYQAAHSNDKELAWHAVCWFDLLGVTDEAKVRSLPAGDPASGKKSDYCE